jgi:pyrimidine operon attenuation protein/uracil phosphoribosyltransferase
MNAQTAARTTLYGPAELEAVLDAMAAQVAGLVPPARDLALVGVLRRGAPLADRLAERLVQRHGRIPPLRLDLAVKRYADDLTLLFPDTRLEENKQLNGLDLTRHSLLVVDDVLYGGHSLLKVLGYLAAWRPAELRVAMLVDRCVARLPVHADVTGLRLQMAAGSVVECHVPPYEPDFRVELVQGEAAS